MELAVLGLLTQALDTGKNLVGEGVKRREAKELLRLYETLQSLETKDIDEHINGITLATYMQGDVSASAVKEVFDRPDFKSLINELFLVSLVHHRQSAEIKAVKSSLESLVTAVLSEKAHKDDSSCFSQKFTERFVDIVYAAKIELAKVDPVLSELMQQTAALKRLHAVLDNVANHNEAITRSSTPEQSRKTDSFINRYRRACRERHGYIIPPDFETNRKVPIDHLYVAPNIEPVDNSTNEFYIDVNEFIAAIDRTVVLGDPGGGKSTLSNYVAYSLAKSDNGVIPFHVTLRHYASYNEDLSLLEFIEHELKPRYQISPEAGIVEDLLINGRALVIFDGLDELIDTSRRRDITRSVELFGIQYPHTPIMVTSRRIGYDQARLDPAIFTTNAISGFSDTEVERYVEKWFHCQKEFSGAQASEQSAAFVEQSAAVPDLRTNPLMLALMCIIFRGENYIPRNRPAVYAKCSTLLFERWDGTRGIEVPLQARDHVEPAMKYMAFEFMTSGSDESGIPKRKVVNLLADYLHPRAFDNTLSAERAAEEFVQYCSGRAWVFTEAGATAEGEPIYTFVHRTFMEYFAAVHLTRVEDTPERLAKTLLPHIAREEWDVVSQLAVQQVNSSTDEGTARALRTMLDDKRRRTFANRGNILSFICRCMTFAIIPPSLLKDITKASLKYSLEMRDSSVTKYPKYDIIFRLRESVTQDDAKICADYLFLEIEKLMLDSESRDAVISIVCAWMSSDLTRSVTSRPLIQPWLQGTLEFVKEHRQAVIERCESPLLVDLYLTWFGHSNESSFDMQLKDGAHGFFDKYFSNSTLNGPNSRLVSISEFLIHSFRAYDEIKTAVQLRIIDKLAAALKSDFRDGDKTLPSLPDLRARYPQRSLVFFRVFDPVFPDSLADAYVIVSLASAEIHMVTERLNPSSRLRNVLVRRLVDLESGNLIAPLKESVSPDVFELFHDWWGREKYIFSNFRALASVYPND